MLSNKQRLFLGLGVLLLLNAAKVFACGCGDLPGIPFADRVNTSLKGATAVFSGKAVGFEYWKDIRNDGAEQMKKNFGLQITYEAKVVKFEVDEWWKLAMAPVVFLITDETRNSDGTIFTSSCNYNFKIGETYLVYADGNVNALKTSDCSRTSPLADAGEDLKILGPGKKPVKAQS